MLLTLYEPEVEGREAGFSNWLMCWFTSADMPFALSLTIHLFWLHAKLLHLFPLHVQARHRALCLVLKLS